MESKAERFQYDVDIGLKRMAFLYDKKWLLMEIVATIYDEMLLQLYRYGYNGDSLRFTYTDELITLSYSEKECARYVDVDYSGVIVKDASRI